MNTEIDPIKAEMSITSSHSKRRLKLGHKKAQEIMRIRLQFPGATNADIARHLNISREWVRHILNGANLPTRAQNKYCELVCDGCGIIFRKRKARVEQQRAKGQERFYHDKKCYVESQLRPLKNRSKRKWDYEAIYKLRREKNWGSVRIGRELGIPTTSVIYILRKEKLTHKYQKRDHEEVCKLRRETRWGCVKIGEKLGIPKGVVAYILKKANLIHGRQKWDHEAVWKLRQEKNWGATRIARELGIPDSTVSFILKKESDLK